MINHYVIYTYLNYAYSPYLIYAKNSRYSYTQNVHLIYAQLIHQGRSSIHLNNYHLTQTSNKSQWYNFYSKNQLFLSYKSQPYGKCYNRCFSEFSVEIAEPFFSISPINPSIWSPTWTTFKSTTLFHFPHKKFDKGNPP